MRPSGLKTRIAVIRKAINTPKLRLTQNEVAGWLNLAPSYYRKIECGKKPLTARHAQTLGRKLNLKPECLFRGEAENFFGGKWKPSDYTAIEKMDKKTKRKIAQVELANVCARVMAILLRAQQSGESDFYEAVLKLKNFTGDLLADVTNTAPGQTVVDRYNILGATIAARHSEMRPDLSPLINAWETGLNNLAKAAKF